MKADPRIWPRTAKGKLGVGIVELLWGIFVLTNHLTGNSTTFDGFLRVVSFIGSLVLITIGVYLIAHGVAQRRRPGDYVR